MRPVLMVLVVQAAQAARGDGDGGGLTSITNGEVSAGFAGAGGLVSFGRANASQPQFFLTGRDSWEITVSVSAVRVVATSLRQGPPGPQPVWLAGTHPVAPRLGCRDAWPTHHLPSARTTQRRAHLCTAPVLQQDWPVRSGDSLI